jgi:Zn-dependent peptidase ImmA (M78 family)
VNRLRAYREIEEINQAELGALLGLSASMIGAIEAGRREMAADLSVLGYAQTRLALPSMSPPLHRFRASTPVASRKRAHELLRLAGEVFGELRAATPKAPATNIERHHGVIDISELATEVRCLLEHEDSGPIHNLTAAVERAGVCLLPIVGLVGIDGLSSWVNGVPVIGLNPAVPGDRFRLTLAHELGHLVMHWDKSEMTESQANQFAGCLLFPPADFEAAMPERPQLRDFVKLKSGWGVSVAAMVYRAHELGHIDDSRYRALQIQMSKWQKQEPAPFEPTVGALFARLIEVNGGIARVAASLGVKLEHLATLATWRHLRAA